MNKKLLIALLFSVITIADIAAHSHTCCVAAACHKKKKPCTDACSSDCNEDHEEEECDGCEDCESCNEQD
jgi:hypothetical protein